MKQEVLKPSDFCPVCDGLKVVEITRETPTSKHVSTIPACNFTPVPLDPREVSVRVWCSVCGTMFHPHSV